MTPSFKHPWLGISAYLKKRNIFLLDLGHCTLNLTLSLKVQTVSKEINYTHVT